MSALELYQLCTARCRCRRCVELLSERALRKHRAKQARFAGLASGRSRRQKARRRRGIHPGGSRRLELTYELRRVSRREFDHRYGKPPERPQAARRWEQGREAMWTYLGGVYALLCVRGQHCRTTSEQRREHLKGKGIPRCRRTIQRYNRRLEQMGIAKFTGRSSWTEAGGWTGYISIQWHVTRRLPIKNVAPPPGTGNHLRSSGVPRVQATSKTSVPPSADDEPPQAAERQGTDDEARQARIRFLQLRLEFPFGDVAEIQVELAQLEAASGPDLARIGANSSRGFRCST